VPDPSTLNVTVPPGGTREATVPASVTVAAHDEAVPGEVAFGLQLMERVVGFAAWTALASTSATLAVSAPTTTRDRDDMLGVSVRALTAP
jgi:hypothetical protein